MKLEAWLLCSQEQANGPYPEPDKSNPLPHPIYLRFILILSFHLRLGILDGPAYFLGFLNSRLFTGKGC
jgi:hypothetical protein